MSKRSLISLVGAAVLLVAALALGMSGTFARYLEMITGDQAFQAKPMEALEISQQWTRVDDTCVLTFSAGEQTKKCRIYLAVSEGVTSADALLVELSAPLAQAATEEQTQTDPSAQTEGQTMTVAATAAMIEEGSAIYNLFGSGTVFRFQDAETQEELVFDLSQDTYTITVSGLDAAVELTSLLRLFVEFVPE